MYDYSYADAAVGGLMAVYYGIALVVYVAMLVGMWKMFTKAGKAGWLVLIPIVNFFTLVKIVTGNAAKGLLMLIPIVNIIFAIKLSIDEAKVYGYSTGMGIVNIFFPFVCVFVFGFGKNEYVGPLKAQPTQEN